MIILLAVGEPTFDDEISALYPAETPKRVQKSLGTSCHLAACQPTKMKCTLWLLRPDGLYKRSPGKQNKEMPPSQGHESLA